MTRSFNLLGLMMVILVIFAKAEHLASRRKCERCGARMQLFKPHDPDRYGSPILRCTRCDWMIDTNRAKD